MVAFAVNRMKAPPSKPMISLRQIKSLPNSVQTFRRQTNLDGIIKLGLLVGYEVVISLDLLPQGILLNPELLSLDGLALLPPQVFSLTYPALQFGLVRKTCNVKPCSARGSLILFNG